MLAVLVTALVAFVAAAVFVRPVLTPAAKAGAAIDAARLPSVHAAKPTPRKAERGTAAAPLPAAFAVVLPARPIIEASRSPASFTPPAKSRAQLMVFLI